RMNGTVELPIGPGRLLLGKTSGLLARLTERWQTSFILNAASAIRTTALPAVSHYYGNPGYMIASPNWTLPKADFEWADGAATGGLYGNSFTSAPDPQCADASQVNGGDKMGTNLQSVCNLVA